MDDLPERKPYLLLLKFDFQINSLRKNRGAAACVTKMRVGDGVLLVSERSTNAACSATIKLRGQRQSG